jgi:hypothetical protein
VFLFHFFLTCAAATSHLLLAVALQHGKALQGFAPCTVAAAGNFRQLEAANLKQQ